MEISLENFLLIVYGNVLYASGKTNRELGRTQLCYFWPFPSLIKSFCGGSRGAVFSKSAPLAAGGKKSSGRRPFFKFDFRKVSWYNRKESLVS
jgi:hypothetical protein